MFNPSAVGTLGAQEERKLAIGTVKSGKKKKLPLNGAGGWHLMRRILEIFYHFPDSKFTLLLVNRKNYKKGKIDQTQVPYCLYLSWLSWTKLCCKKICAPSTSFMYE